MREGCYDCARAEWDSEGATCGINGLHVNRPSLGCNKRVPKKRMTNGDRVRNMTDEELAEFLDEYSSCSLCEGYKRGICTREECFKGFLAWLRKEVDEDD